MTRKIAPFVFILFFIFIIYGYNKRRNQRKAYHFSGIIEKITYDVTACPGGNALIGVLMFVFTPALAAAYGEGFPAWAIAY